MAGGPKPFTIPDDHFKYVVFKDANWDFRTLNFDSDVALADEPDKGIFNATDPNLSEFVEHGGKLILYHGWNDALIAPQNTVDYFDSVVAVMGGTSKVGNSMRLFMAPDMNHCFGGEGPCVFDMISALEQWVEKGTAPEQIRASHLTDGKVDRTRPLCPYPQVAKYNGSGSTDDASSFGCTKE